MVSTDTFYARSFLRSLFRSAQQAGIALIDAINAAADKAAASASAGGRILIGTSVNGKSASFTVPSSANSYSSADNAALCEELVLFY